MILEFINKILVALAYIVLVLAAIYVLIFLGVIITSIYAAWMDEREMDNNK